MPPQTRSRALNSSQWRDVNDGLFGAHAGFEMAFAPALFALLGLWIDSMLGTTPLLVIAFAIGGVIGAVLSVYYRYRYAMAEASRVRQQAEAELAELRDGSAVSEGAT